MKSPIALALLLAPACLAAPAPLDEWLSQGRFREGMEAYARPEDDAGRFSLALLQSLDGLQRFSAGFNRLGFRQGPVTQFLPFLRAIPGGETAAAQPAPAATPEKIAALFADLRASLRRAGQTLAKLEGGDWKVEVTLTEIRMDFNGDGQVADDERLAQTLGRRLGLPLPARGEAALTVRFDAADAYWLRGYTHALSGILEVFMAYDWRPAWDQCAHRLFLNPVPAPPIARHSVASGNDFNDVVDFIAALHDCRLPLADKDGLRRAREEYLAMVADSRACWKSVLAEADDDHEWLPSPRQAGPAGARINRAQVEAWPRVLDELEEILAGRALLPHWRMKDGSGINLDKLIASPPPFDPVLMIQGSAFLPYLEEGRISDRARWAELSRAFQGGFWRFAIWSN